MTFVLGEQQVDIDATGYSQFSVGLSATAELAPESKQTTCSDKSTRSKKRTQRLKSLPTSAVDLTGGGKDYDPYWNKRCEENSQQLWSPTVTDSADSVTSLSNGCSNKTIANSWFTNKFVNNPNSDSRKISQRLSTFFPADSMVGEVIKRSKKIRLRPTAEQREKLELILRAARWFYNEACARGVDNRFDVQTEMVTNGTPEWASSVPYKVRQMAIQQFVDALWVARRRLGRHFKMGFRSRKNPNQQAFVPKTAVKEKSFFTTLLGKDLRPSEKIETAGDCLLLKQGGEYYLQVVTNHTVSENQASGIVSIDPGVRTFITTFSPTTVGQLGTEAAKRIYRLCLHLDNLISRRVCGKAIRRVRAKIQNLLSDMHHKLALWLVRNYKVVIYPAFDVAKLAMKGNFSKSTRQMLTLAHGRFRQILFDKCVAHATTLVYVSEAWTSKTCSCCGKIHDIGPSRVMDCCGKKIDRDVNGARGVLLRALRDTSAQLVVQT